MVVVEVVGGGGGGVVEVVGGTEIEKKYGQRSNDKMN